MAPEPAAPQAAFTLPVMVASSVDVGRLVRELELIDDTLRQLGIRTGGTAVKMPKTSHLMDVTIQANKLNLLQSAHRVALKQFLESVKRQSPVLHVSFSADPSPAFIEKLMVWLRKEIHPAVLLTVGLQPNIGAGCIVRTTNKQFDFSLREDFLQKRDLLLSQLAAPVPQPAAAPEPVSEKAVV